MTDDDPIARMAMPFGKYKGMALKDVPATYLLWCWDKFLWERTNAQSEVAYYIRENFHALETECPDLLVRHRP